MCASKVGGKKLPSAYGPSTLTTLASDPDAQSNANDPVKGVRMVKVKPKVLSCQQKRTAKAKVLVDEELFGYLQSQAVLRNRSATLAHRLLVKGFNFLRDYDVQHLTHLEMTKMVVNAVAGVMNVTEEEQALQEHLGSKKGNAQRWKLKGFLQTGLVRKRGSWWRFWVKERSLPMEP